MTAEIQAAQLAWSFALGVGLGLLYDVYRVWFRAAGRRWLKAVGDIIWWLAALLVAAWAMYHINGLALRGFPLALALLGCVVEQGLISPQFFPLMRRLCGGLLAVAGRLLGIFRGLLELLLTPLVWCVELVFRLLVIAKRLLLCVFGLVFRVLKLLTSPVWLPIVKLGRRVRRGVRRRIRAMLTDKSTNAAEGSGENEEIPEEIPTEA